MCWLDPGAFGTLGVGGGFALGAKLCRPDADVWIVYGDGSLGYSIAEFDSFTRHKVSHCLFIALNDYTISYSLQNGETSYQVSTTFFKNRNKLSTR